MKTKFLFALLLSGVFFSSSAKNSNASPDTLLSSQVVQQDTHGVYVDSTLSVPMLAYSLTDGFFTTGAQYDPSYDSIRYLPCRGEMACFKNDNSRTALFGRCDSTNKLLWIRYGGGPGDDVAFNYSYVPLENAVYVLGYFSDSAFFPYTYKNGKDSGSAVAKVATHGFTDMFVARCNSETGELIWINGVGSPGRDVALTVTDSLGQNLHIEAAMKPELAVLYVWAKCGAPYQFGNKTLNSNSTNFVMFTFDRLRGELLNAQVVASIPKQ